MPNKHFYHSTIGTLKITEEKEHIIGLYLLTNQDEVPEKMADSPRSATLTEACHQLDEYFAGARRDFDLPLQLHGSEFQQRIWQQLRRIPYGQVSSYGEVALDAGYPRAARAVGNACNRNHLAIVVPCHRVVAANSLGGFGHRMDIKLTLLRLEGYLK